MKIIYIFTVFFILWEILRVFKGEMFWKFVKENWTNRETTLKINLFQIIKWTYSFFIGFLLFTTAWKISVGIILISALSSVILFPSIKENSPYTKEIKTITIINSLISIYLLLHIIF